MATAMSNAMTHECAIAHAAEASYRHFAARLNSSPRPRNCNGGERGQSAQACIGCHGDHLRDIAAFVDFYLDEAHRDGTLADVPAAVAALAGDAPRKNAGVQAQFRKHIEGNLEVLSKALPPGASPAEARAAAILVLSALYGALIMARAVGDSPLSREVLRTVRRQVGAMSDPPLKPLARNRAGKK